MWKQIEDSIFCWYLRNFLNRDYVVKLYHRYETQLFEEFKDSKGNLYIFIGKETYLVNWNHHV